MGEHDRNIMFLSGRNHLVVPDRAAGFHDCCDPGRGKDIEAVPEWEEPVAGGDGPGRTVPCLHKRPFRCAHSALIPGAHADRRPVLDDDNRVRFGVGGNHPRHLEVVKFVGRGLAGPGFPALGPRLNRVMPLNKEPIVDGAHIEIVR